jgi:tetratricopeptide (TPR) repeat protein
LPSAQDILAANMGKPKPQASCSAVGTNWDQGTPTLPQEPGQWAAPLWLTWPPAMLLTLVLGVAWSQLSWQWACESFNASVVANRLLAGAEGAGKEKPLPESVVPPDIAWWQSSPLHLTQWGAYLGRSRTSEPRAENVRTLLEGAIRISPLNPTARLAWLQVDPRLNGPAGQTVGLGMSRDAITLCWSARLLRRAGKKEAAMRAYRQAIRIACRPDLSRTSSLDFNDDRAVSRYLLPGEAIAAPIVRELIADAIWTFPEWSEALPRNTVAPLVAARLLRDQGRPEAETLIERIIEADQRSSTTAAERAIQLATIAEAHALRSRWREAEQQYRQAIDMIDETTIKRSWWFNLAVIASQLEDETQRQTALDVILAVSTSDDISRRASDLQRTTGARGRLRSNGTKAN